MFGLEQDTQEITGSENCGIERGGRSGAGLEAVVMVFAAGVIIDCDEIRGEVVGESATTTAFLDLELGGPLADARAAVLSDESWIGTSE